jgi:hypothetical protein
LVEVDLLEPEVAQAQMQLLAQVFGPADRTPVVGAGVGLTALGGDDDIVGVRVQSETDEALTDERAVGVGECR